MTDRDYPRTAYEARLDLTYARTLWAVHVRFWRRVRACFGIVLFVGASFAVVSLVEQSPGFAVTASVALVLVAALEWVLAPAERQAEAEQRRRAYQKALSELPAQADLEAIDALLERLRVDDLPSLKVLERIAYDENVLSHGRESYAMGRWYWPRMLGLA